MLLPDSPAERTLKGSELIVKFSVKFLLMSQGLICLHIVPVCLHKPPQPINHLQISASNHSSRFLLWQQSSLQMTNHYNSCSSGELNIEHRADRTHWWVNGFTMTRFLKMLDLDETTVPALLGFDASIDECFKFLYIFINLCCNIIPIQTQHNCLVVTGVARLPRSWTCKGSRGAL